jgi:hypothetical protein
MAATLLAWLTDAPEADLTAERMQAEQTEATSTRNGGQPAAKPAPAPKDEDGPPVTLQHLLDTFDLDRNQLRTFLREEAPEFFGNLSPAGLARLTPEQLGRAAAFLGAAKQPAEAGS